ncbi:MAG TPA: DinB family protein [Candidatus Limnocylindrales bacterium]|nr:DinB family protein [Candidatus Limnocylindrales bacterium]
MRRADVEYLFAYDRWATRRVLAVIDGLPDDAWGATGVVGDRGLGAILVHQLGAHMRWRLGLGGDDEAASRARPERELLPSPEAMAGRWAAEWDLMDAFLGELTDDALEVRHDGVPVWQMLAHLANHGTQHRSEAAVILTDAGRSPGDLDMIFFAEEIARDRS